MAEHELTPKNSIGGPFPPELDSDSASDDDDITSGPMVIKSNTSPAIQPKMRPSIFTADFDTPGTGEQVLGQVMDPVSPSHALFNIVADRQFCFFQPKTWVKEAIDKRTVTSTVDTDSGRHFFSEVHSTTSAMCGATDKPFMRRKKRRRSSVTKGLVKDNIGIGGMAGVMKKLGCHFVYYSDTIIKVNRKGKAQERVLVVTENGLFNLEPKTHECKRQIPYYDISKISCSLLDDNFFVIHVPNEYDYLMVSSNKTEIVSLVSLLYLWSCGDPLKVAFMNLIEYTADKEMKQHKQIHFTNHEDGVYTEIISNPIIK
eukprot:TRINITY_DN1106_c3_g1_i3.p1 TRINITY_DN1106_c3_g1~~TRINITY_DN1106_c3_g1_i3.p1  ORF type:complete len:335 (-),score=79.07 TRINITY_DN1106_c3_g1_i3:177-1121(-)